MRAMLATKRIEDAVEAGLRVTRPIDPPTPSDNPPGPVQMAVHNRISAAGQDAASRSGRLGIRTPCGVPPAASDNRPLSRSLVEYRMRALLLAGSALAAALVLSPAPAEANGFGGFRGGHHGYRAGFHGPRHHGYRR